jgi:hypothetical protein
MSQITRPTVPGERPLFTWLVRVGVLANLAVVALIVYLYLAAP